MKNPDPKHLNSLLRNVLTFFALQKQKTKKRSLYWVIEENEEENLPCKVKYYNEYNQLIHTQIFPGLYRGILDEETIDRLNRVKSKIQ